MMKQLDICEDICVKDLKGIDTLARFYAMFDKGDNFCDILFAVLCTKFATEKRSTLKGRNLLPSGFIG